MHPNLAVATQHTTDHSHQKSIKRVLLLSLPALMEAGDDYLNDGHSFHLGIAYIAALLRSKGLEVKILDSYAEDRMQLRSSSDQHWHEYGMSDEDIVRAIGDYAPDMIGMTIPFSCQHYLAMQIARCIKAQFPQLILVVGGNHVTAVPQDIDRSVIDYLILGEGEYALLSLIQSLNNGQAVDERVGIMQHDSQECIHSKHIDDLDALPFPALDLLPLEKLWKTGRRWINMVATRGCVYSCNFCSIHTIMGHRIRRRSVENVIAEIEHWKRLYKIQEIYFEDDNLTANKKWAKQLFSEIARRKFNIRFYARNGIRADSIDKELLVLMKAAGFQDFMIAPESGSQETLDTIIGKKMKLEDCTRAVKLAHEVNLGVNLFFVIGFPGETWQQIDATISYARYLKSLGANGVWISMASPYPGTRLFQQCMENDFIPKDYDYRRCRTADYQIANPNYTAAELKAYRNQAMLSLVSRHTPGVAARNALHLLISDPMYLMVKLRYKLQV